MSTNVSFLNGILEQKRDIKLKKKKKRNPNKTETFVNNNNASLPFCQS